MIFNFQWVSGLVVGLETVPVLLFDTEEDFDIEQPPNVQYMLHLGIFTVSLIIR
jgi:hypothetical protein